MSTIRDVARLAGVSAATVSRVLNDKGYVSEEKKEKIEKVIKELKYEPNQVARGLAKKTSKTLALIVTDIANPFFPELAKGAEKIAYLNGYSLLLGNTKGMDHQDDDYVKLLMNKYIDGVIIASHDIDTKILKEQENTPMVVLEMDNDIENACTIKVDNYYGAMVATRHLLTAGCRKIAHIYGPQYDSTAKERLEGYKAVISGTLGATAILTAGDFTINGGAEAAQNLLNKYPDIDGIFAGNDLMAIGVLKKLNQLKVKVPEDIAVCGFDGIFLTQVTNPELTTIEQPIYKMGELAAEKLIFRINHPSYKKETIELKTKLNIRESTLIIRSGNKRKHFVDK
ncbi:LacI family DNA-binding transcriptional regulator [Sporolactobacillus pectinivorans]|uniref:LacI family DNA-binding transcriptional regulator n=1 Tax=Sporolactobacillus pectinivorans TaxID=1591408 RepID=UPI000C2596F0|nr:LacI family DNA-binding transcriptional regulator [Sporolactobacillus pectinivorans]